MRDRSFVIGNHLLVVGGPVGDAVSAGFVNHLCWGSPRVPPKIPIFSLVGLHIECKGGSISAERMASVKASSTLWKRESTLLRSIGEAHHHM